MYVLDTSALSEVIKRRPNQGLIARLKEKPPEVLFTTVITAMGLRYGALLRPDGEALSRWIWKELETLPFASVTVIGARCAFVRLVLLSWRRRRG